MPVYNAQESALIPEGEVVAAVVESIEEKEFDFGFRLAWSFKVVGGEHDGMFINDLTSLKFTISPPSKFYKYAQALTGIDYGDGDLIDTDDLIHLPCRIEVAHNPGRNRDGDEVVYMKPALIMPPRSASSAENVFG